MMSDNSEFTKNLLNQIFELWVVPELERRKKSPEEISHVRGAQIIFYPNGKRQEIRIDDEVLVIRKVKLKPGIYKEKGEPIHDNEVEEIELIGLTEEDDPDCAHLTVVKLLNTWFISFDFRYNKAFSKRHLQIAKEFYESAKISYEKKNWAAFIDNLFSSAELVAKATLLATPDLKFRKKATHKGIQLKYNKDASMGNVPLDYKNVLNKLSGWREIVRYPKVDRSLRIDEKDALKLLETVGLMIGDCEKGIGIRDGKY